MGEDNIGKNNKILGLTDLYKSFLGVQALKAIDRDLHAGEIHGLVGENDAGKYTLVEILTGNYPFDSGDLNIDGERYSYLSPAKALSPGIETVHQEDQDAFVTTLSNGGA